MKFGYEHEEAVSPVIGVILMVAITVILAATIGVFVFGMANEAPTTQKSVSVTVTERNGDAIFTYMGGDDAKELKYLKLNVNETIRYTTTASGTLSTTAPTTDFTLETGSVMRIDKPHDYPEPVTVVGYFKDGSEQVLLRTNV